VIGLLPAMWCWLSALILPCVMLAGYGGMCPFDQPALFSCAQHHTCIWIHPDSAARE
jgi:hypothetical protein